MRQDRFIERMRPAAFTPRRKAVCIGTAMATKRARSIVFGSSRSTARSMTAGENPPLSSSARGEAKDRG